MAGTVLRKGENGEITHVHFCTIDGEKIYLLKPDYYKMLEFSKEQVDDYYSGTTSDELESVKEDIADILTGMKEPEVIKYRIAVSIGFLNEKSVIKKH